MGCVIMSDVTVLGCGNMGSALARAFIGAGHRTTVWNRTVERTRPLVAAGANLASSVVGAVAASPLVAVCVADYQATRALLSPSEVASLLSGHSLVELSTGTPEDARGAERWANALGAAYIDGAIMTYPENIGKPEALILFAGEDAVWQRCRPLVACLGGRTVHLGRDVGSAAAVDLALLSKFLGACAGAAHAASICEAEGIDLSHVLALMDDGDDSKDILGVIKSQQLANPGATINTWHGAVEIIGRQVRDSGISGVVPEFISSLTKQAIASGNGDEHIAALYKLLLRKS